MATSSVVQTASLPSNFESYYTGANGLIEQARNLYGQGNAQSFASYYGDPAQQLGLFGAGRVAGLTNAQKSVGTQLENLSTPGAFGAGNQFLQAAGQGIQGLVGYQPQQVQAQGLGQMSQWGAGPMAQYMSPYQQGVTDIAKREAVRDAQMSQLGNNLAAARQGTYGGSRQLLAQMERERNLNTKLSDLQTQGLQNAYTTGQQQFNADRTANLTSFQQMLDAQKANQSAGLQANQQSIQGYQGLGALGQTAAGLGTAQQAADLDRLKTLGAYGDYQRQINQQGLDARYADFTRMIDYPQTQLNNMNSFIRGVPMTDQTQTTTTPAPSMWSQLAGAGITGLAAYNAFK